MQNVFPYEVIAYPYKVWVAPVGTAFPDLHTDPPSPWALIGSSGNLNYDDAAGVTVRHSQSMVKWRSLGDSGPRKVFRTEEDLQVQLKLVDLTLEQYSYAINSNSVTDVPGVAGVTTGHRKLGLSRGLSVATMALLVRGVSSYGDNETNPWISQYEIPFACQGGNPEIQYVKSTPAGLDLIWDAIVDPDAESDDERFGRLLVQDANWS